MTARLFFCVLLLSTTSLVTGQAPNAGTGLSVSSSGRSLQISYGGKVRLAGGQPGFETSTPAIAGLLGIWNCADANRIEGSFKPSDVHGIKGEKFAMYEHFSAELVVSGRNDEIAVSLGRLGYRLYSIVPLVDGNGVIGLVNKYNATATVLRSSISAKAIKATVVEGGRFAAIEMRNPSKVKVDEMDVPFIYRDGLVLIDVPLADSRNAREVDIECQ